MVDFCLHELFSRVWLLLLSSLFAVVDGRVSGSDRFWKCTGPATQLTDEGCLTSPLQDKACYRSDIWDNQMRPCGRVCNDVAEASLPERHCNEDCPNYLDEFCHLQSTASTPAPTPAAAVAVSPAAIVGISCVALLFVTTSAGRLYRCARLRRFGQQHTQENSRGGSDGQRSPGNGGNGTDEALPLTETESPPNETRAITATDD